MKLNALICAVMSVLFTLFCMGAGAQQEADAAFDVALVMNNGAMGSSICYPQLESEAHPDIAQKINDAVMRTAELDAYARVLNALDEGSVGLRVRSDYALNDAYFSLLISAEGKMPMGRPSQRYYAMMFDLATGDSVPFEALFKDVEGARAYLEEAMDGQVSDILSTYMDNSLLLPLPEDNFAILHEQLVLCYDNSQFSFLSGDAGAVAFYLDELSTYVDPALESFRCDKDALSLAQEALAQGTLPGLKTRPDVQLTLGTSVEDIVSALRQTMDAAHYPSGALIEVEDAFLRGTMLMTDEREETLTGLLSNRLSFGGILTGETTVEGWRALLGEPQSSIVLDQAAAESLRLASGVTDAYTFNSEHTLTLNADENGVLYAVQIK